LSAIQNPLVRCEARPYAIEACIWGRGCDNLCYRAAIDAALTRRYDVIVAGARVAGASTAMLLARAGLSVLVVERGREGTDTLSTHALMRAGVLQLRRWGVLDAVIARGTPVVRATTFHYGDEAVSVALKPRDGIEGLYAPRRFVLDKILVGAARAAGAHVAYGVTVTDVVRDGDRVAGIVAKPNDGAPIEIRAGLVVGADGMFSTIAKLVAAPTYHAGGHTTAIVFNYFAGIALDGYHWYYGPGVSIGAIPTNDELTCVFAAMPPARFAASARDVAGAHAAVIRECNPEFHATLAGARAAERYRGFAGLVGYARQSHGPGWALVGDAAYFKDPLTAHGMTDALVDVEHLARAIASGGDAALAAYQRARDDRTRRFFELTDAIASFAWDMSSIRTLHLGLSEEMKRETAGVLALDGGA
jgi:2-polyprenyl-6-methoxyphenol hydroxylase-like FAD-dependent oxidoreductase